MIGGATLLNSSSGAARLGYHPLTVKAVRAETADSRTFVLEVPPHLTDVFSYRAGQFVTVRITVSGTVHPRSYSMSSAPEVDSDLEITVKRMPGGVVSNWLVDEVFEGGCLEVSPPGGSFVLEPGDHGLVAFAAGSGITPVLSILKSVLASTTERRFRLLYASRDRESMIFGDILDQLAKDRGPQFDLECRFDDEHGLVDGATITRFVGAELGSEFFLCGPEPFMNTVNATLKWSGVRGNRVHIERFDPVTDDLPAAPIEDRALTIVLGGRPTSVVYKSGATILQAARSAGLRAPSSCESGDCATCMARVVEGRAEMRHNAVLTQDEVAEGWVLTCQSLPMTPTVKVVYE